MPDDATRRPARPLRPLLVPLLAGAALALGLLTFTRTWYGPSELAPWPLLGCLVGLSLGGSVPGWTGAGLLLIGALGLPASALVDVSGFVLLAGGGALAGRLAARPSEDRLLGSTVFVLGFSAGLLLVQDAVVGRAVAAFVAAAALALVLGRDAAPVNDSPAEEPALADRVLPPLVLLRVGASLALGAAGLALLAKSVPTSLDGEGRRLLNGDGVLLATWKAAGSLLVGLTAGLFVGRWPQLQSRVVPGVCEPIGWLLLLILGWYVPEGVLDGGRGLRMLLLLGGALGGVSLAGSLLRAPQRGWALALALVLAWPLGLVLQRACAASWTLPEQIVLALGQGQAEDEGFEQAVDQERIRLRFSPPGLALAPVHVVDVQNPRAKADTYRVITVAGRVRGGTPIHALKPRAVSAAHVLQGALPFLLAEEPPRRVALLGLGTGVSAGACLQIDALETLTAVEPARAVVACHRDPGDLFGFVNRRPLDDARFRLRATAPARFLRTQPTASWDAILLTHLAPAHPLPALVVARTRGLSLWLLRDPRAVELAQFAPLPAYAFAPNDEVLILLVGPATFTLSLERLQQRWASPGLGALRRELGRVGLRTPLQLLSTLVAGPPTLLRLGHELKTAVVGNEALARAGAVDLPDVVVFPKERGAEARAALAVQLLRRRSPAALPMARAALRARRGPETLRVLGEVLHLQGEALKAQALWLKAIEMAPEAVAPRLSLAWLHHDQSAFEAGRRVLEPAAGRDAQREPEVQYLLGRLALGLREYRVALKHLRAAGRFRKAHELARRVRVEIKSAPGRKLTPTQRLEAAGKLLTRLRTTRNWRRGRSILDDAVGLILPLAHAPGALSAAQRGRLANLLRACGEHHDEVPEGATAARTLFRLQAEVLAPLIVDRRHVLARARALGRAGRPAEGERILADLLERSTTKYSARVHRILGELRLEQKKYDAAIASFRRCLAGRRASILNTQIYLQMADAHRGAKRLAKAIAVLETSERLYPGHPKVRLNLGTLLLEQGEKARAVEWYKRFLETVDTSHPYWKKVDAKLKELEGN